MRTLFYLATAYRHPIRSE